jgi:hypothetical protein
VQTKSSCGVITLDDLVLWRSDEICSNFALLLLKLSLIKFHSRRQFVRREREARPKPQEEKQMVWVLLHEQLVSTPVISSESQSDFEEMCSADEHLHVNGDKLVTSLQGRAMAVAVSHRPLSADGPVRLQFSTCWICGEESVTGTGSSPSSLVFLC